MIRKILLPFFFLPIISVSQDIVHWEYIVDESNQRIQVFDIPNSEVPEKRIALVIGNSNYIDPKLYLKNTIPDARLMDSCLRNIGFDVILKEDLNSKQLVHVISDYLKKLDTSDFGIFYFAGHGQENEEGDSYLVPIDYSLDHPPDFFLKDLILDSEISKKKCLVILDACREIIQEGFRKPSFLRGDPLYVKLAYSTSTGSKAFDYEELPNSLYTTFLASQIQIKHLTIQNILEEVQFQILKMTNDEQYPIDYYGGKINRVKLQ